MLHLDGISKRFGSTVALDGLSLTAERGRIIGIAGPNGAGKSTLAHVLAGELAEDSGSVRLDGRALAVAERPQAVAIVHQELRLFPNLTVLDNLLVGHRGRWWTRPQAHATILDLAEEFGLVRHLNEEAGRSSIVVQQLTEIVKAIAQRKELILLDEPNSALTREESERLFDEVQRVRDSRGAIVLLVSHRLGDLERWCDSVCVVRDGKVLETLVGDRIVSSEIAAGVAGRAPAAGIGIPRTLHVPDPGKSDAHEPPVVLEVRDWTDAIGTAFGEIELSIRAGEILFLTGQEDGGGRQLLRSLVRLHPARGDAVVLPDSRRGEVVYVPGSRSRSLFANLSVRGNLSIRAAGKSQRHRGGLLNIATLSGTASHYIDRLAIKTSGPMSSVTALSGGTQQKVALGSALAAAPRLMIAEEPTRGVDVHTRAEIVEILREFAAGGGAVLGFSPELEEVFELATDVRVARDGRLSTPWPQRATHSLTDFAHWVDSQVSATRRSETTIPASSGPRQ